MKYRNEDLEQIKRSLPPWKLLTDRGVSVKKTGKEYLASCPLHQEKTPSFTIYLDGDIWLWKCHGCGRSGNVFQLVEALDSLSFSESVAKVAALAGWQAGKTKIETVFSEPLPSKPHLTIPIANLLPAKEALQNAPQAQEWLSSRGISTETAAKLHWGFVQSAKAVVPYHPWVDDGWILTPTIKGNIITGLKYRSVKGKETPTGEKGFARKKNMATTLYNLEAIEPWEDVWVCEGEPDVAILTQAGFRAVGYPTANYTPTPEERRAILQANTIYLAGDMDTAGQAAMTKLWSELRDRTYKISWPDGCKDANDAYLKNPEGFVHLVDELKARAQEIPLPHIYDMKQTLLRADATKPLDNPSRLRFPWKTIDQWTAVLPGDVMSVFATESKTGKTTWVMNVLLCSAIEHGKVVVNYSAEVLPEAYARRMAACLTRQDRNTLTKEDFEKASAKMRDAKFYNGYKPGANYKEVIELLTWAKKILGADIIVVDNLHFLTRSERDQWKAESEAMRMLKDLATEYNMIVICVGAVRKAPGTSRGREAVAQDAKGSEAFSADASQVYILHRKRLPSTDENNALVFDPVTKCILDYSREGEARSTRLMFDGKTATFYELSSSQNEREPGEDDD